jgi:RimJ/RimL family protein N-acetyltransferase
MTVTFWKIDDEAFARIWDSIVTDAAPDSFPRRLAETPKAEWHPVREKWDRVMQEIRRGHERIGYIFLSPKNDGTAHLGYGLYESHRGRKLMASIAAAFIAQELPALPPEVTELLASVLRENVASQRTLARLGFVADGETQTDGITYLRFRRPR